MKTGYAFGRASLDADIDDPGAAAWLSEFLCPWAEPIQAGRGDVLVRFDAFSGAWDALARRRLAPAPSAFPCFALDSRVVCLPGWPEAGSTVVVDEEFDCFYRVANRAVHIVARPGCRRARLGLMRTVREILVSRALDGGTLLDLHAAAFAAGGRAVLLAGAKNAGKTTLLIHALASGHADFVANDRVFVSVDGNAAIAIGVPTIVSVRPWTAAAFPALQGDGLSHAPTLSVGEDPPEGSGGAASAPVGLPNGAAWSPAQFTHRLRVARARGGTVHAVVLPVIDPEVSTWALEPLAPAKAEALLGACLYGASSHPRPRTIFEAAGAAGLDAERRALMVRTLAAGAPCVSLRLGPDAYRESAAGWLRALGLAAGPGIADPPQDLARERGRTRPPG
ncbi:MAG TPA: hypothetical protein PLE61_12215 [Vicinamibacterales bacterium]|nr:hypothetical protein [Vicinamibacterales bacterium]HPW21567.1 hypothetical protein [Vicinamibacterales bacterium]